MKNNFIINVDKIEYIKEYKECGITTFLFALKDYSVGYNSFTIEEINNIDEENKYLLINRVLDCESIDNLKKLLPKIKNIKGIFYEDIGIINIVKDPNIELILFQNHFNTNTYSINYWLDRVTSVVISNELTKEELTYITKNAKKPIVLHLYGHNQVMYSRRLLLTNWSKNFNIVNKNTNLIEDISTKVRFRVIENEYGTVMYSDKIFNGKELLSLNNIKYFYINPTLIDHSIVIDFLNNMKTHTNELEDNGFLEKETIYKLKGGN